MVDPWKKKPPFMVRNKDLAIIILIMKRSFEKNRQWLNKSRIRLEPVIEYSVGIFCYSFIRVCYWYGGYRSSADIATRLRIESYRKTLKVHLIFFRLSKPECISSYFFLPMVTFKWYLVGNLHYRCCGFNRVHDFNRVLPQIEPYHYESFPKRDEKKNWFSDFLSLRCSGDR